MMIRWSPYFASLAIAILVFCGCGRKGELYTFSRMQIGTLINITVIADTPERGVRASNAAFSEIARVESLMSPKRAGSDIVSINNSAWKAPVHISGETYALMRKSIAISEQTDGAFDITFASVGTLWQLANPSFVPPDSAVVKKRLYLVNFRNIELDDAAHTVMFKHKGIQIGLGGIAKGHAVGLAAAALRREGVRASIIDAGGDLMVRGTKFGNTWRVGLRHPRNDEILLVFTAHDGDAIVTSGDYERYKIVKGVRYHHILDPHTGFPAKGLISATVVCSDPIDAVDADAYATALFVMGGVRAREFTKKHPELRVILIDEGMKISASKALKKRITPLEKVAIEWF